MKLYVRNVNHQITKNYFPHLVQQTALRFSHIIAVQVEIAVLTATVTEAVQTGLVV
jgi:hypothetical protein